MTKESIIALLADNYLQAAFVDEETTWRLRNILTDVAYRLFLKAQENEEAEAELHKLVTIAAAEYNVSITQLIKERLDWAKWWESRYGEGKK